MSSFTFTSCRAAVASRLNASKGPTRAVATKSSRRMMLTSLAGFGAVAVADQAAALTDMPLYDDRKEGSKVKVAWEAADEQLPIAVRNGIKQFRGDADATRTRLVAARAKLDEDLMPLVSKEYWGSAREELRLHLGTIRQDVNTLVDTQTSKADKKAARELAKAFAMKTNALDYAIEKKDLASALSTYAQVQDTWSALSSRILG